MGSLLIFQILTILGDGEPLMMMMMMMMMMMICFCGMVD